MSSPSKMPRMQWTPEADQTLLLTLVKTHALKIDYAAISESWPDASVKPTARAVKERMTKIQELHKSRSVGVQTPTKRKRDTRASTPQPKKCTPKKQRASENPSHQVEDTLDDAAGVLEAEPAKEVAEEASSDSETEEHTLV
ncbi:hypothetical protein N7492_006214 [Penicillium capsulatum]|uniref:Myb-like domain-containing protein n=1 Tax=Penicillium capsulatum TaxID=69766 RepID=A0A9W9I361_9EURO|nr:hypothetical protein N7492_006214 [Penicillium capsulatum]KAJ6108867.1 hypothetical protein N7512_008704 [Penicillium capsulatum]